MTDLVKCALCGFERPATSGAYRWVCNNGRKLAAGYYQPRLTWDELHSLPFGESAVCTSRQGCEGRQDMQRYKNLTIEPPTLHDLAQAHFDRLGGCTNSANEWDAERWREENRLMDAALN